MKMQSWEWDKPIHPKEFDEPYFTHLNLIPIMLLQLILCPKMGQETNKQTILSQEDEQVIKAHKSNYP